MLFLFLLSDNQIKDKSKQEGKQRNQTKNQTTKQCTPLSMLHLRFVFFSSFFFVQTIRKTANTKSNKKANKEIKRKKTCNDYQKNKQTKQTKKQCMTLSMLHLRFVFFALLHLSSCRQPVSVIKGNQTKSKKQQHMHTKRQR